MHGVLIADMMQRFTHMDSDAVVTRDDDDPNQTPRNCSTCISNSPKRRILGKGGQDSPI